MTAQALTTPRFVRKTVLGRSEYRKNFKQIDCDTISVLVSKEASRVTTLMSKIYLSLINAPVELWEREGVLRFSGKEQDGRWLTAWEQLVGLLDVANATANKALRWMHEQGIIGYFSGKNGVGIRIFINRASSSIGIASVKAQKNLSVAPVSNDENPASRAVIPFRDSFANLETLDSNVYSGARKDRANDVGTCEKTSAQGPDEKNEHRPMMFSAEDRCPAPVHTTGANSPQIGRDALELMTRRLRAELETVLQAVAVKAAAKEHEKTREWLELRGLPKAVRVAQRETYNILKQRGMCGTSGRIIGAVGQYDEDERRLNGNGVPSVSKSLSAAELDELAEACLTLLEAHGQPIELTIAQLSEGPGGYLTASEAARVRAVAMTKMRQEQKRVGEIEQT